ncbi:ADP-ribosylation factor GTPase-activating protein AGD3-like [Zea mays]|uniref:ADP-ribosylation factor GTPase-activating protein AGD3-like n=1 Tax=Zea mays TaxID=4577 RepID=UPI0009A97E2D|nr:ADP-ribosylation factor GTPase-activating protein AGD3-like [Zea mays]|eukprot:XP_020400908.1 ADP-ribosylation factor GTPase-activating protein AGD3-like [Zea mays]
MRGQVMAVKVISKAKIREKYLSLKKGTRPDITTAIEDELHSARSSFEQARFNLVTSLSHVEATKSYEFLEAVSATMDSHLRILNKDMNYCIKWNHILISWER